MSSALALLVVTSLACANAVTIPEFDAFLQLHGRDYKQGSAEYEERKMLYNQRKDEMELHNSDANRRWTAGVNELWDWRESELATLRNWDGGATATSSPSMRPAR